MRTYNELNADVAEARARIAALRKEMLEGIYEAKDIYKAKEGESLYSISQKFGIRLSNLTKMNRVNSFVTMREGEKIRLK